MKDYIYMLSAASVVGGAVILLAGNGKMQKPIKFVACLIMLLLLISPFADIKKTSLITDNGEISKYAESIYTAAAETVYGEACRLAEDCICDSIYAEFGIKPISCRISFDSGSGTGILSIIVDASCTDTESISKYASSLSGIKAEVITDEN